MAENSTHDLFVCDGQVTMSMYCTTKFAQKYPSIRIVFDLKPQSALGIYPRNIGVKRFYLYSGFYAFYTDGNHDSETLVAISPDTIAAAGAAIKKTMEDRCVPVIAISPSGIEDINSADEIINIRNNCDYDACEGLTRGRTIGRNPTATAEFQRSRFPAWLTPSPLTNVPTGWYVSRHLGALLIQIPPSIKIDYDAVIPPQELPIIEPLPPRKLLLQAKKKHKPLVNPLPPRAKPAAPQKEARETITAKAAPRHRSYFPG